MVDFTWESKGRLLGLLGGIALTVCVVDEALTARADQRHAADMQANRVARAEEARRQREAEAAAKAERERLDRLRRRLAVCACGLGVWAGIYACVGLLLAIPTYAIHPHAFWVPAAVLAPLWALHAGLLAVAASRGGFEWAGSGWETATGWSWRPTDGDVEFLAAVLTDAQVAAVVCDGMREFTFLQSARRERARVRAFIAAVRCLHTSDPAGLQAALDSRAPIDTTIADALRTGADRTAAW